MKNDDLHILQKFFVEGQLYIAELKKENAQLKQALDEFMPYMKLMSRSSKNREIPLTVIRAEIKAILNKYVNITRQKLPKRLEVKRQDTPQI